jgi:chemotaxis protein MotB
MSLRKPSILVAGLLLLLTSGCAARYQALLRDRDLELRELKGQVSDLRSENAELQRRGSMVEPRPASVDNVAAPAAAADSELDRLQGDLPDLDVRRKQGRLSIGIENTVTFDSGSVALKKGADRVLRQVGAVLRRDFLGRQIYVEGHTDTDPIRKTRSRFRSNFQLSAERAEVVAGFLIKECGVAPEDVVVVGYGPNDPRVPGSSESSKARNRRVEVVVGD